LVAHEVFFGVLTESDDDCEGENVSEGEQAVYAARSAFRR
jgi:hypothetical protein